MIVLANSRRDFLCKTLVAQICADPLFAYNQPEYYIKCKYDLCNYILCNIFAL